MFFCDRATSVLFPQIDKIIQVYACCITNKVSCPFCLPNKCKKTQKTIRSRQDYVEPARTKLESVATNTDDEVGSNVKSNETSDFLHTKDSNTSDDNTTNMYLIEESNTVTNSEKNSNARKSTSKKLRRRKRRNQNARKDTGVQSKKEKKKTMKTKKEGPPIQMMPSKLVNTRQSTFDRKSLISLYRKRKDKQPDKENPCSCPLNQKRNIAEKEKPRKKRKSITEKPDIRFELKPKGENENIGDERDGKRLTDKPCVKGLCSKAMKMKDTNFVCSCENKNKSAPSPVICTNKTCSKEYSMAKKSSMTRIKEIMSLVFHNILRGRNVTIDDICEEGVCKDAYDQHNKDICCKCKLKVKKCSDMTCAASKNNKSFCEKLLKFRSKRNYKEPVRENVVVQNEKDQTNDPLFELKVNAMDMCVMNSSEIKRKVKTLGLLKKQDQCVCPSHEERKQYILEREACLGGACRKALKDKKTNFTCNCLKNKVWTCEDSTCIKAVTFDNGDKNCRCKGQLLNSPRFQKEMINKPLFELQVDSNNMCILNTNEMLHKMDDIKRRTNKFCRYGICNEKSEDGDARIVCKCKKRMKYDECAEETCKIVNKCKFSQKCCRCGKPRTTNKMVRSNLDTASLRNISSKFSGFCTRMFCRSDDNRHKKRKRFSRRRTTMLRSQSDNVHKRDGFKIMIKQQNGDKTMNACNTNCCSCDYYKTTTQPKTDKHVKGNLFERGKSQKFKPEQIKTQKDQPAFTKTQKYKPKQTKTERVPTEQTDKFLLQQTKITKQTAEESPQTEKLKKWQVKKRKAVEVPVPNSELAKNSSEMVKNITLPWQSSKEKIQTICQCYHECECDLVERKRRMKERKEKRKQKGHDYKKKLEKKKQSASEDHRWMKESLEKKKQFAKERKRLLKHEAQRRKKQKKEELEMMRLLESEDGARRTNCCVEFLGQILSAGFATLKVFFYALFKIISDPKGSYWYTRERLQDPQATLILIKRTIRKGWNIRKLKVAKCMRNSETVSILSDTFKESGFYQTFADKGKTKKEQENFEAESKKRKRRVRKRNDAALYGCRHVLLTTLRKTPCLWVYHVCPELYPQCLSCLAFTRNFWHLCLFMLALACWTPCIVVCELMRGLCCCLLCTG